MKYDRTRIGTLALLATLGGCVDAITDDTPGYSQYILPPGTALESIPSIRTNESVARQIDEFDGVDGKLIPRQRAYVDGETVHYWDFGPAPEFAIPVFIIGRCEEPGGPGQTATQPNIIDAVPGDPGYSPFWTMLRVCVTPKWSGEIFTSLAAIQDGVELGLVQEPTPFRPGGEGTATHWANCPVVLDDVAVAVDDNGGTVLPHQGFYRGFRAHYYHFGGGIVVDNGNLGMMPLVDDLVRVEPTYILRRQNESAPMTNNDVFPVDRCGRDGSGTCRTVLDNYTPLWRIVDVTVPSDYSSGALNSEQDMFQRSGDDLRSIDSQVLDFQVTDTLVNRPIQANVGGI